MAAADISKLTAILEAHMEESSSVYRTEVANKKTHIITVSADRIKTEVKEELIKRGAVNPQTKQLSLKLVEIVNKEVTKMVAGMYEDFKHYNDSGLKKTEVSGMKGDSKEFTFVLAHKESESNASVFNAFRNIKQNNQGDLLTKIRAQIKKLNAGRKGDKIKSPTKNFLDIGHEKGSSVAEQRQGAVRRDVKSTLAVYNTKMNAAGKKIIKSLVSDLQFKITKNNGKELDQMKVSLESSRLNKSKGGKEEKNIIIELNADLQNVIESLGAEFWADQESSDSSITKRKKRVLAAFTAKNFKGKGIRSNIKPQKIKDTDSSAKGKKKTSKAKAGAAYTDNTPFNVGKPSRKTSGSMFSFVALINKKLPKTVRDNMNGSGLQNRTGRFARSVKVMDVNTTKQGHPSFGYTYAKNPYQVFEVGTGSPPWATPDRDPRKLIDRSIREVAAEMALGRFYTRRL